MSENVMRPRAPRYRPLIWSDSILNFIDEILDDDLPPLYIVGGAVRDALLHRPQKDLDLATPADAIRLGRRLVDALGGDIYIMDAERGVVRIFLKSQNALTEESLIIDIANFRGPDLYADLADRDFTINAIACDIRNLSQIIDPLEGERDLQEKVIRRCSETTLADDPIRCLRAVRQSVQLNFRIEPSTLADIRHHGRQLRVTSPERVRDEFFSLLGLERVATALRILNAVKLTEYVLPKLNAISNTTWQAMLTAVEKLVTVLTAISPRRSDSTVAMFDLAMLVIQLDRYRAQLLEHISGHWPNQRSHWSLLVLGLCACFSDEDDSSESQRSLQNGHSPDSASEIAEQLKLSQQERRRLSQMVHAAQVFLQQTQWNALQYHRYWFTYREAGVDGILLAMMVYLGKTGVALVQADWLEQVDRAQAVLNAFFIHYDEIVEPVLYVDGNVLVSELQLAQGPVIGQLLTLIREAQVQGLVKDTDGALALAREFLKRRAQ